MRDSDFDAPTVLFKRLPHAEGLPDPAYQTAGAAGLDLTAAIAPSAKLVIEPGAWELVPTGLMIELPSGWEAQARPRSGLALKHGVTVLNAPGTIDSDYRGEIGVVLINHGPRPFEISRGDRVAQLVIARAPQAKVLFATELSGTTRGAGGYGSTGKR
jgi:dUTP pyrophosphatase